MYTPYVLCVLGTWASELDRAGNFEVADGLDIYIDDLYLNHEPAGELERQVMHKLWGAAVEFLNYHDIDTDEDDLSKIHDLVEELTEHFLEKFDQRILREQDIDDGIFGLNDADNPTVKAANLVTIANDLDVNGLYAEADLLDFCLAAPKKPPNPPRPLDPRETAYSLYRILVHLMQRSGSNQAAAMANMRKGLSKLSPLDIASKKANPAAAVGAAINIIKNVLVGQDPSIIGSVIMELQRLV